MPVAPATRFDALVVGAGPAGSIAALVLARGGARVALVDKASFPRDKACGDLVGPRGVQLLDDLAIELGPVPRVADMLVVGPSGHRVRLPAAPGRTYPGFGLVVTRARFDDALREAAIAAGAAFVEGQARDAIHDDGRLAGFELSGPHGSPATRVVADVVIGADGATSRVADAASLLDSARVLWGFAVRAYLDETVELPHIILWSPAGRAFPGYGWVFPADPCGVNVGLGVGVLTDRQAARRATRDLDAFLDHAAHLGVLRDGARSPSAARPLGAWLKMGMVGTVPARGRVLLAGDAAGLVNPLQGEGIAQAMDSGRAAADAILYGVDTAATRYRAHLSRTHARYLSTTSAVQRALLRHPSAVDPLMRALTTPAVSRVIAGGWAIAWNDLRDGAAPGRARAVATAAAGVGRALTATTADRRWLRAHLAPTDAPTPSEPASLRQAFHA